RPATRRRPSAARPTPGKEQPTAGQRPRTVHPASNHLRPPPPSDTAPQPAHAREALNSRKPNPAGHCHAPHPILVPGELVDQGAGFEVPDRQGAVGGLRNNASSVGAHTAPQMSGYPAPVAPSMIAVAALLELARWSRQRAQHPGASPKTHSAG